MTMTRNWYIFYIYNRNLSSLVVKFLFYFILFLYGFSSVSALSVSVHVPEKYTEVVAGERFYFEIEVKYPENPKRKDLRLDYEILDSSGEMIAHAKALKAVETQASFIDFIVIPESAKKGLYDININIKDYESLSKEFSASFNIKSSGIDRVVVYFLVIMGTIILVGMLVVVGLLKKKK